MTDGPYAVDLEGRTALVTGAAGTIGSNVVRELARAGARVVASDRHAEAVNALVEQLRAQGRQAHAVSGDLARSVAIDALFSEAERVFGEPDILVTCAALMDTEGDPLSVEDDRVDEILGVNLRAPLLCSLRAARGMAAHRGGAIVNLSSVGGSQRSHRHNVIYDVAKGGIDALTRALATDLGPLGIRVNAVGPAAVTSDPPHGRGGDLPLRRGGTPEDVAWAVLYLVSDAARFVTGQVLYVDGGLMAQLRSPEGARSSQ